MEYQSNHKKDKEERIKIIVKNSNSSPFEFIYNKNEKVEKLINEYYEKVKLLKDYSFLFLYDGKKLKKNQTFSEVINNIDKESSEMVVLAQSYKSESNIKITLSIKSNEIDLQEKKEETFENIIRRGILKINKEYNSNNYEFFYKGNKLDFNKKFDDIADIEDLKSRIMKIDAKEKVIKKSINKAKETISHTEENIANNNSKNYPMNNQLFSGNLIYGKNPGGDLKKSKISMKNYDVLIANQIKQLNQTNLTSHTIQDNNSITIKPINTERPKIQNEISFFKKYKNYLIILSVIIIIIIIALIIFLILKKSSDNNNIIKENTQSSNPNDTSNPDESIDTTEDTVINDDNKDECEIGEEEKCLTCIENKNECKTCNIGYKLVNGKCKTDYFIKVVYFTKQKNDKIEIINNYSDVVFMIIEGKNITSFNNNYLFKEEGYQTVYFQFEKKLFYSTKLFANNKHIVSVTFSDFNEYKIYMQFNSMFEGCINLTSVDFSKLSYVYEPGKYELEKKGTQYMFYGCINLKYINIKNVKALGSAAYMFNNCKSLTSIDLSNFDISNTYYLNNMFTNCISLQTINLAEFKLDTGNTIESMFKNCYSLKSLDLSAFKPLNLENMNSAFYNCSSLTSINFLDFYCDILNDLGYLFYNCSSLKEINIIDFNTKNVKNMQSMFEGCTSLTSIIIGSNFEINNNLKYIDSMFARCHSLTSINFDLIITNKIASLYSLFSDCHSLTSINLKNFDTSEVDDFEYMFYNCYNLKNIDITNFSINSNSNLKRMFSGCYLITSIDFSNIKPNYYQFDEIFYDCPNLNYVDFSFIRVFPYWYFYKESYYLFNKNISKSGTLILNEEYYNNYLKKLEIYPPDGWTLNLTLN